jgi:uncharacterized protein GlcG (DUF336 family)
MTPDPIRAATREQSRVALVTSDLFPDLYDDDFPLRDELRARGVEVDAVRWDDPTADWAGYDLAVIRSTWDYAPRRDEFVKWARSVRRLANPADIIEWNTDKRYLRSLAAAGIAVTPTEFVPPSGSWTPPASGEWVIKPTISAAAQDTGRYRLPAEASLAEAHVRRLQKAGRTAMIQPYLTAVDTDGETSILCTPDAAGSLTYSHAIRKDALLTGPHTGEPAGEYSETISPRTPSAAELALAAATLALVPGGSGRLLYARVDMIPGPDGSPLLVELELTEPGLFFREGPGSAARLAAAIVARL